MAIDGGEFVCMYVNGVGKGAILEVTKEVVARCFQGGYGISMLDKCVEEGVRGREL